MEEGIGRREFFGNIFRDFKYLAGSVMNAAIAEQSFIRPPGAIEEIEFLTSCQRCGSCAAICPKKAIKIAGPDKGAAVGTPYLQPENQSCTFCLECVAVCPSHVLDNKQTKEALVIGKAAIDNKLCLAFKHQLCGSCRYACDRGAIELIDYQYPTINKEKCNGCGACAQICLAPLTAIKVKPL